ncbi:MAG TPA: PilW family protein [Roseateles sp.]
MVMQSRPNLRRRLRGPSGIRGVTLIELMIGLLLGVVVVLVTAQVMSFAEGQKRVTTGGADAQVNGALGLYTLQREIQMSGYGLLSQLFALGCPVRANHASAGAFNWTLAPVIITAGTSGAPDSITVMSSSRAYAVPASISVNHPTTSDRFTLRSALGISVGDMVIAVPASYSATNWCGAYQVTALANSNQAVHGNSSSWNSGAQVAPTAGYFAGDRLMNAGQMVLRTFSVDANKNLQQQTLDLGTGTMQVQPLFPQIVQLRAFYGKDTDADGVVDTYDTVTPTTGAGWRQVLAVRIALVARSSSYQKEEVTAAAPQWDVGTAATVTGSATCGSSNCIAMTVSGLTDWKHYRYSLFEVTAPLRNVIWN